MPNIWDAQRIDSNLQVLANLSNAGQGKKLDIKPDGTLSTYLPSTFGIEAITRWSSPSVTDVRGFQQPLIRLFEESIKRPNIRDHLVGIRAAYKGLKSLRSSYGGTKLEALNQLISRVHAEIYIWGLRDLVNFHQQYRKYSRFPFAQANFFKLKGANEGVCMALTYYWVMKRLHDENWNFTTGEMHRIRSALVQTQSKYQTLKNIGRLDKRIAELDKLAAGDLWKNSERLRVQRTTINGTRKTINDRDDGAKIFKSIVDECTSMGGSIYFVTYEGSDPHVLGLHLRSSSVDFFDSNLGEMSFGSTQQEKTDTFYSFCTDMWVANLKPDGTFYWDLAAAELGGARE